MWYIYTVEYYSSIKKNEIEIDITRNHLVKQSKPGSEDKVVDVFLISG
jgi:hypothetical protein